jgi:transcription-repair coupling factor (superfamily II helicase)
MIIWLSRVARRRGPAILAFIHRAARKPVFVPPARSTGRGPDDGLQKFLGSSRSSFRPTTRSPSRPTETVLHIWSSQWRAIARLRAQAELGPAAHRARSTRSCSHAGRRAALERDIIDIGWGQNSRRRPFRRKLVAMGYDREAPSKAPASSRPRLDVESTARRRAALAARLFGEDVEQIRQFDPVTQRSRPRDDEIETIRILPRRSGAALAASTPGKAWGRSSTAGAGDGPLATAVAHRTAPDPFGDLPRGIGRRGSARPRDESP